MIMIIPSMSSSNVIIVYKDDQSLLVKKYDLSRLYVEDCRSL